MEIFNPCRAVCAYKTQMTPLEDWAGMPTEFETEILDSLLEAALRNRVLDDTPAPDRAIIVARRPTTEQRPN